MQARQSPHFAVILTATGLEPRQNPLMQNIMFSLLLLLFFFATKNVFERIADKICEGFLCSACSLSVIRDRDVDRTFANI